MRTFLILAAVLALATAVGAPAMQGNPEDEEAIRKQIERLAQVHEKGDAKAIAALWDLDGDMIIRSDSVVKGRAAVEKAMAEVYSQREEGFTITITMDSIRFLKPDVAIVNTSAEGTKSKERKPWNDRGTWVMIRKDSQWLVAALRVMEPVMIASPTSDN